MKRQRSDEQRKQQIRAAAIRCFVSRGYAATRLLDIAREAGLSKGGVYFHYRAKEQLFHEILDNQLAAFVERWSFEPVDDKPADLLLAHLVRAHAQTLEDRPDETRLTNLLVSMAAQEREFRDKLEHALNVSRDLYATVIARGIAEGVFRTGDPEELAHAVVALVQGFSARSALDPQGRLPIAIDAIVLSALRLLGSSREVPQWAAVGTLAAAGSPAEEDPAEPVAAASEADKPAS